MFGTIHITEVIYMIAEPTHESITLSSSVQKLLKDHEGKKMTSWEVTLTLLQSHPRYAEGIDSKFMELPGPRNARSYTIEDWIASTVDFFERYPPAMLHGRLVIIALVFLDTSLHNYLPSDFLHRIFDGALKESTSSGEAAGFLDMLRSKKFWTAPVPGIRTDIPHSGMPDLLDIEKEVNTMASLMMYRQVHPPLAIGLFGDWGSGKSFFMEKLAYRIQEVTQYYHKQERDHNKPAPWITRVAQIRFNAWHYSDTNLWACLISHIYDNLRAYLSPEGENDGEKQKRLAGQDERLKKIQEKTEVLIGHVEKRVKDTKEAYQKAIENRTAEENNLANLLRATVSGTRRAIFRDNTSENVIEAMKMLGVSNVVENEEAFAQLMKDVESTQNRARLLGKSVIQSPLSVTVFAVILLATPLLISAIAEIEWVRSLLGDIGKNVIQSRGSGRACVKGRIISPLWSLPSLKLNRRLTAIFAAIRPFSMPNGNLNLPSAKKSHSRRNTRNARTN
jgi:hypothetical protein